MATSRRKSHEVLGLSRTLDLLAHTPNEAAVRVLTAALDSANVRIQEGALQAAVERRSPEGHLEVIARLHLHADRWRPIIEQCRGRMGQALRNALLSTNDQLCDNACQATLWFREYDLMPALIHNAEERGNPHAPRATRTLLGLAERLQEEIAVPGNYGHKRDPHLICSTTLGHLEASIKKFSRHQVREIIQAYVMLANRKSMGLLQMVQDLHHPAHQYLMELLLKNEHPSTLRLLTQFLEDAQVPQGILSVWTRRTDRTFLKAFLEKIGTEPSLAVVNNLKRIDHLAWVEQEDLWLGQLDDVGQTSVLKAIAASGLKRSQVLHVVERILTSGTPGGQRAAAIVLNRFQGADATALLLAALPDAEPHVQAILASQLRPRGIPGALTQLINLSESPHAVVRQAIRESLVEFSFDRYLAAFDLLDDHVRSSTGKLVKKVNPQSLQTLEEELRCRSRSRRLRAVAIALAMEVVVEMEPALIDLLQDEDHLVRSESARALGACTTQAGRDALLKALHDRSPVVQEQAATSLTHLGVSFQWEPNLGSVEKT